MSPSYPPMRRVLVLATALLPIATVSCDQETAGSTSVRAGTLSTAPFVEGTYQALVARGHDGSSWLIHRLAQGDTVITLDRHDVEPLAPPGSTLRVWGVDADAGHTVDSFEVLNGPAIPIIDGDPFAERRLAVIVLQWGETPVFDVAEVEQKMFTADYSTRNYFAEISYGKERLTGEVFGSYEIPYVGCDSDSIAYYAREAMKTDGHDTSGFDQFMYVFPDAPCGWSGLAMLGYPQDPAEDSWYNGSFNCVVRNQEVAHNYGLMHTHFYYGCSGGAPFASSCSFEEYGSPYDPMGYGCGHMAVPDKEWMGWTEECNIVTATADGVFNLVPSETPCNGTQALRLPTFDGRYYYLEYRQPLGFDADEALDGVLVHVSEPDGDTYWGPDAYLIDLGEGAFLGEGQSYTGPSDEVTFTVAEQQDTHAVIEVTFPGGGSGDPTCTGGGAPPQQAGVWGTLECTGGPFSPDNAPPTVSVLRPSDGEVFPLGSTVIVEADAQDDVLISSVALYVDDALVGTVTNPPYGWQVPDLSEGQHTVVVRASDGIHEAETPKVVIEVSDRPGGDSDSDGDGDSDSGPGGGGDDDDDGVDDDDADGDGIPDSDALPPGFGGERGGLGCAAGRDRPAPLNFGWLVLPVLLCLRDRRLSRALARRRKAGRRSTRSD